MSPRMSSATSGALVRKSDSEQPVHSWKCSQITAGFAPEADFSAIFSPAHAGSPTAPAAIVQTLRKSRRPTPIASDCVMNCLQVCARNPDEGQHAACRAGDASFNRNSSYLECDSPERGDTTVVIGAVR